MQLDSYQDEAMVYRLATSDATYALLNLSGEVGELHSLVAKALRDGKQKDYYQNLAKELGDILWMVSAIASDNALSLEMIALANLNKLESRARRNVLTGSGDNR